MAVSPRRPLRHLPAAREIARPQVPLTSKRGWKVLLTDTILLSLSKRSDIISKFPFFRIAGKIATGTCGGCNAGIKRNKRIEELTRVKAAIVGLPQGQKNLLKDILKAETITLYLPSANGTISHTF